MKRKILMIIAAVLFIHSASFQAIIFWRMWQHQSVTIYDYNPWFNRAEMVTSIGVLALAVYMLVTLVLEYIRADRP